MLSLSQFTSDDERGAIASMLMEPATIPVVCRLVGARDFGDATLRIVFEAIYREHRQPSEFDAVNVVRRVREDQRVADTNAVFAELAEAVVTSAHAEAFAKGVRDASLKRRILDAVSVAHEATSSGGNAEAVLADLLAFAEEESRSAGGSGGVPRLSGTQLIEQYPEMKPPVIDGLIREGETANIIAAPKARKSWLVYGLVLSVLNNERWLGRFDVSTGKVLLVDNELHPETLSSRLRYVAEAMGIEYDTVAEDLEVWPLRGNLRSLNELLSEFDRFEPSELKLIVFDAKYRFASIDGVENANEDETKFMNLVDRIAAKTNAACVLIHHSSKGDQAGKAVTDVGSGAGAQSRSADAHIVIRPHEEDDCVVMDAALRSFPPVTPVTMRWAAPVWIADERLDPKKLAGLKGKGQQARNDENVQGKRSILEALESDPDGLSVRAIRRATGFGKSKAERLLDGLEANFMVERFEGVSGHNPCTMYRLPSGGGTEGGTGDEPPLVRVPGGGVVPPLIEGADHPPLNPGTPAVPPSDAPGGDIPFPEFERFTEGVA